MAEGLPQHHTSWHHEGGCKWVCWGLLNFFLNFWSSQISGSLFLRLSRPGCSNVPHFFPPQKKGSDSKWLGERKKIYTSFFYFSVHTSIPTCLSVAYLPLLHWDVDIFGMFSSAPQTSATEIAKFQFTGEKMCALYPIHLYSGKQHLCNYAWIATGLGKA